MNPPLRMRGPDQTPKRRVRGESLIALLVGLALGLGVLTGCIHLWMVTLKAQRSALQETHLHQDLHAALDWMAQELRHAQYLNPAWQKRTATDCNDAFCGLPEDFSVSDSQIEFSWDRNDNGVKDTTECSGFQLREGQLRIKTNCTSGQWQVISHAQNVKVSVLQFTPHCAWANGSLQRYIDIQLSAALPSEPTNTITHQVSVYLRNAQPVSTLAKSTALCS